MQKVIVFVFFSMVLFCNWEEWGHTLNSEYRYIIHNSRFDPAHNDFGMRHNVWYGSIDSTPTKLKIIK